MNVLDDDFPCNVEFRGHNYNSVTHAVICESHDKEICMILRKIKSIKDLKTLSHQFRPKGDTTSLRHMIRVNKFLQNENLRRRLMDAEPSNEVIKRLQKDLEGIPFKQGDLFWTTPSS